LKWFFDDFIFYSRCFIDEAELKKLGHEDEEKEKKDLTPFQKPIWTVHRQYRTPPVTPNGCFL
jgi:hypothetical protein